MLIDDCLTFFRFPESRWNRIRTSNVIERAFTEVRRRTLVVGRLPTEQSASTLIWPSIEQDRLRWRGIYMDADILEAAVEAVEEAKRLPTRIESARRYLAAA